ncbi:MAG: NAD-binding protein [Thermoplasmata archaeon]
MNKTYSFMNNKYANLSSKVKNAFVNITFSHWFKITVIILWINMTSSAIYSLSEGIGFLDAAFFIILNFFTEYPQDPVTFSGKVSSLVIVVTGFLFLALTVGEFSRYFLHRLINRGMIEQRRVFYGDSHIIILGVNRNLNGILTELRSDELDPISKPPVIIVDPKIDKVRIVDKKIRADVYGIKASPVDFNTFKKIQLEKAKSILVLSPENFSDISTYRDSYVAAVERAVKKYLMSDEVRGKVAHDINIVLQFVDEKTNILSYCESSEIEVKAYFEEIGEHHIITEPIYLERMPTYLFVQSIIDKNIDEFVRRLLTTQYKDTNEIYYIELPREYVKNHKEMSFYDIQKSLLNSNTTPIGILRRYSSQEKVCSHMERKLLINPDTKIEAGDQIILIAYDESDVRAAKQVLRSKAKSFTPRAQVKPAKLPDRIYDPFENTSQIVIVNWNWPQLQCIMDEVVKIADYTNRKGNGDRPQAIPHPKKDIIILTEKMANQSIDKEIERINCKIREKGLENSLSITVKIYDILDSNILRDIIKGKEKTTKFVVLSEQTEKDGTGLDAVQQQITESLGLSESEPNLVSDHPDQLVLHMAQLIEKFGSNIFTAVEVRKPEMMPFFSHLNCDVIICVEDMSEKLLAQALLKPCISMVFRELLTFNPDSYEFYTINVPDIFVTKKKTIRDIQERFIGTKALFIGHIREVEGKSRITINPKQSGYYYNKQESKVKVLSAGLDNIIWNDARAPKFEISYPRVMRKDKLKSGDKIIMLAATLQEVEEIMASISIEG